MRSPFCIPPCRSKSANWSAHLRAANHSWVHSLQAKLTPQEVLTLPFIYQIPLHVCVKIECHVHDSGTGAEGICIQGSPIHIRHSSVSQPALHDCIMDAGPIREAGRPVLEDLVPARPPHLPWQPSWVNVQRLQQPPDLHQARCSVSRI